MHIIVPKKLVVTVIVNSAIRQRRIGKSNANPTTLHMSIFH